MKTISLFIPIAILFYMGLVMIFDTSSAEILDWHLEKHTWYDLIKQMVFGLVGLGLALVCYRWGHERILFYSPQLLLVATVLLICPFLPGIGRAVNGSHRWIAIGLLSVQPSEFAKYIILAFFIHKLDVLGGTFSNFKEFFKTVGPLIVPIGLIFIEPNNGTVGVIVISLVVLSFVAKVPFKYWGIPVVIGCIVACTVVLTVPYVQGRISAYMHPERDILGKGHQPYQAKIAAGSGQLMGKGPGRSIQKLSYLPEAQNDYIAAIVAEEYGFIGILCLIMMYMLFALFGTEIALRCESGSSFLMASGIVFLISFQAFLNLGVVSGLLPSTGLNLPFFSQGGTSLVANAAGLGILVDIQRKGAWKKFS